MIEVHHSPIVKFTERLLRPFLVLFGLYVLFHGHESPGGGFQAGTILAASYILEALAWGSESVRYSRLVQYAFRIAALGAFIYVACGLAGVFANTAFLDYEALPLSALSAADRRWWGIFGVELGVCLVVMSCFVAIFDRMYSGDPLDG